MQDLEGDVLGKSLSAGWCCQQQGRLQAAAPGGWLTLCCYVLQVLFRFLVWETVSAAGAARASSLSAAHSSAHMPSLVLYSCSLCVSGQRKFPRHHIRQADTFVCVPQSYDVYISVFYLLAAIILGSVVVTLWVAWLLKKDENGSTWIKRWVQDCISCLCEGHNSWLLPGLFMDPMPVWCCNNMCCLKHLSAVATPACASRLSFL